MQALLQTMPTMLWRQQFNAANSAPPNGAEAEYLHLQLKLGFNGPDKPERKVISNVLQGSMETSR